jgi:hypothetical protein
VNILEVKYLACLFVCLFNVFNEAEQAVHITDHLWHRHSVAVNQAAIIKRLI